MKNSTLFAYRTEMYACLLWAGDALMNLNDALLTDYAALLDLRPLFLGDGGYGNVAFLLKTYDIACDRLVRLAKNRVLYRPKPPVQTNQDADVHPKMEPSFGVVTQLHMATPMRIGKEPMTKRSGWKWIVGTGCISKRRVTSRFPCCAYPVMALRTTSAILG